MRWRADLRDRGAVLVEFALVAPVLVLLLLGVFEYGNAWKQVGAAERLVQQAGRTVSSQANSRFADYETLRAIDTSVANLRGFDVTRVVIYKATAADGKVPSACLTASQGGLCNRYVGSVLSSASMAAFPGGSSTNPTCAGGSADGAWCPVNRDRSSTTPDRVGVHVTFSYTPVTGLLPGPSVEVKRYAVYQLEPCAQGSTRC